MKRRTVMLGRVLAGVALAALVVAPASGVGGAAGTGSQLAWCDPMASAGAASGSGAVSLGRGGPIREPDLGQVHEDLPAVGQGPRRRGLQRDRPGLLPRRHRRRDRQRSPTRRSPPRSTVLNRTFAGGEGGAKDRLLFRLAGVTRTDNADWFYAGPGGTNEHSMKATLHQGGANALNFYSTTAGDYLGWAYLPDIVTKPGQAYLDGIVVDWESIPGTSTTYAGRYDQGETATHEVGHWLNLEHTFYGGCNAKGDFVDDTPAEKTPTSGCPAGKDTCTAPGLDPIHNYMDYSYDSCYTEFTAGQTQRMRDAWLLYRAG